MTTIEDVEGAVRVSGPEKLREGVRRMVDERKTQKKAKALERARKNLGDALRAKRTADVTYWRGRIAELERQP